jgi:DNA-binding response OmpR family regulator
MKGKIIIIEDDNDLRTLMGLTLNSVGYQVKTFAGEEVLEENTGALADLYIIDINLGGKSGLELCKKIKALRKDGEAPVIIIISAHPDAKQLAKDACADDTLPKPFTAKELLRKISEYFPSVV